MNPLDAYMQRNCISPESVKDELYQMVLLSCVQRISLAVRRDPGVEACLRRAYRRSADDIRFGREMAETYCGCSLSDKEAQWLSRCIQAHFRKKSVRRVVIQSQMERLARQQENRCPCCGRDFHKIGAAAQADHMIPWEFVGDELEGNLRLLCEDCNRNRGDRPEYILKQMFFNQTKEEAGSYETNLSSEEYTGS